MQNSKTQKFQNLLSENNLEGFIVTNPVNIYYLTGFKGVSPTEREAILVFNPKATLITAKLYINEAKTVKSKDVKIKIIKERNELLTLITKLLTNSPKIGFESDNLTYGEYKEFKTRLIGKKLSPVKNLIEEMRQTKTNEELALIEKAQTISQKAFDLIIKTVKTGETEKEIAERLKQIMISLGAEDYAFEPIVASGIHSGSPHHVTSRKKIKKGEVLLFDFGAKYKNYCADLTRTVFIGKANSVQKNIYALVLKSQENAISSIVVNQKASETYNNANGVFKSKSLEKYFIHGLGHGIGLEVHEPPYLRKTTNHVLEEGTVFSIEPGLYFNWGGVRIEDLVTIKNGKTKTLGKNRAEFIEI